MAQRSLIKAIAKAAKALYSQMVVRAAVIPALRRIRQEFKVIFGCVAFQNKIKATDMLCLSQEGAVPGVRPGRLRA